MFLLQRFPAFCCAELFRQCGHVAGFGNKLRKRGGVGLMLRLRLLDLPRVGLGLLYKGANFSLDTGLFGVFLLSFFLSDRPFLEMGYST